MLASRLPWQPDEMQLLCKGCQTLMHVGQGDKSQLKILGLAGEAYPYQYFWQPAETRQRTLHGDIHQHGLLGALLAFHVVNEPRALF